MAAKKGGIEGLDSVSSSVVAEALGFTDRRIRQLVDDGVLPARKVGKLLKFDLLEAVRAYIDYLREQLKTRDVSDGDLSEQKLQAEVDFRRAKAAEENLMLAELEGNMHRSEDVEASFEQLVYTMRSDLIAVPGRVAIDAAKAETPATAEKVVREAINEVLGHLADFRYDPAFYRKLVRDRRGWREEDAGGPRQGEEPQ